MDGELVHFTPSPAGASPRVASCSTQTPRPTSPQPLCQAQAAKQWLAHLCALPCGRVPGLFPLVFKHDSDLRKAMKGQSLGVGEGISQGIGARPNAAGGGGGEPTGA